MPTNFPTTLNTTSTEPTWDGSGTLAAPGGSNSALAHASTHTNHSDAIRAIEAKVGVGASTPTTVGDVLQVTAAGATAYGIPSLINVNTRTASYTLVLGDAGKLVEMNVASANTLTVPPNSSVAFPVGSQVALRQYGAGVTTVTAGAGVTIRSRGGLVATAGTYAEATLTKRATDEWVLSGDIS